MACTICELQIYHFSVVRRLSFFGLPLTPAAKLSVGMKTVTSLSRDNLDTKVGKISHREIRPAGI